ncbi:preprotein translocase subunit SecG [Rhizobium sp. P40RR-XXII]|uniref:preprotein translocase subunit SecG n=1 Tax=unclassified Rhizobium TaxID=2613769 RepID=UPI0014564EC1|nr:MULTISPECIES: preprotein translocase subunit SecG [unclassified Rhizobium]NLR83493.1 preprotein translocase subunit SecG [Rhizobium sp. P28RR-XV]NLS15913.1 preprotein translocase subunit SecG [Rhizobium sp. P40RR-XXII]
MQTVLLVIYLMIVVALIGVVLIQRSEGGGLGIGGGSGFMSARGTANALTRTTAILAALFFALALGMNVLSRFEARPTDVLNRIPSTAGQGNGILDSLGGQKSPAPATTQPKPADNSGVPNGGAVAPQSQATPPATTNQPAATAPAQQAPAATGQQTAPATTTPAPADNGGVPTGK